MRNKRLIFERSKPIADNAVMCKVANPVRHDFHYVVLAPDDHWGSDKVRVMHDCRETSAVLAHPKLGPAKDLLSRQSPSLVVRTAPASLAGIPATSHYVVPRLCYYVVAAGA
jgi:hypothetical protein